MLGHPPAPSQNGTSYEIFNKKRKPLSRLFILCRVVERETMGKPSTSHSAGTGFEFLVPTLPEIIELII